MAERLLVQRQIDEQGRRERGPGALRARARA